MLNNCHKSASSIFLDYHPVLEGLKILIVDDEADTLDMLKVALEQYSAEVRTEGSSMPSGAPIAIRFLRLALVPALP